MDFIHKLRIGLKELRETKRWLRLIVKVMPSHTFPELPALLAETDELIRIFVASIKTASQRKVEEK
jgi:four helix bundle protein